MGQVIGVLFWALIAYLIYRRWSKKRQLKKDLRELANQKAVSPVESYPVSNKPAPFSDEDLMKELETLLVIEDKKLVREFIKEYEEMEIPLPLKVAAKAKAFLSGREWQFEDEIRKSPAKEVKKPTSRNNNTAYKNLIVSQTFTALDFETANSARNSACSVGYVRVVDGKITDEGYSLIKPKNAEVSAINRAIHGITDQQIATAPDFTEVWKDLEPIVANNLVVAHNCDFDLSVLLAMLDDHNLPIPEFRVMCSQKLVQEAFLDLKNYRLNDAASYFNIELEHHNALSDAKVCALVTVNSLKTGHDFGFVYNQPEITKHIGKKASETKKDRSLSGVYASKKINTALLKPNLEAENKEHPFYNKGIVFTGDLPTLSRQVAAEKAQALGADIKSGISGKVQYVVVGDNAGPAKLKKVEDLQLKGHEIKVLSEEEFVAML